MQICRLLRGFTHPGTYFDASGGGEIALYRYATRASLARRIEPYMP